MSARPGGGGWRACLAAPIVAALAVVAGGCQLLQPPSLPAFYALGAAAGPASGPRPPAPDAGVLVIDPPSAAAGFGSTRMIYVREPYRLESFAHSEWVDPPARMLAPLLVAALEQSAAFRAVFAAPSGAAGDFHLETEIVALQQEFDDQPSRARFTIRAILVDSATRRVLLTRAFEARVVAPSADPRGGVVAANRAVAAALGELAQACAQAVAAHGRAASLP